MLSLTAIGLIVAGLFAWFLAVTNQLLPHDLAWLMVSEPELRAIADGRLVHFMAHDRAAFGGTIIAVGVLYLWLIRFPLAHGDAWAWWTLALTGALGFATFLTYLATGYLDTWHGVATLAILPPFLLGLYQTRPSVRTVSVRWRLPRSWPPADHRAIGRALIVLTGVGMLAAGTTILLLGSVFVFVPQDLAFLELDRAALVSIDPRLVPLIAHDRIGFGGGLATVGCVVDRVRGELADHALALGSAAPRGFRRVRVGRRGPRAHRVSRPGARRARVPRRGGLRGRHGAHAIRRGRRGAATAA